ncbi:MAG TPA: universal stress protein [Candidatus Lambdaproteobacteria bacterium]|nr:universal stress protein [Candidatus Lambdaproteobacteria bacterium]
MINVRLLSFPVVLFFWNFINHEDRHLLMLLLNTILVPTDCSDYSRIALRYASRLAAEFGAGVALLYVEKQSKQKDSKSFAIDHKSDSCGRGQQNLENFLGNIDTFSSKLSLVVVEGEVVSEIINYTKQEVVDLILMSSHGYKGLAYSTKGSITEKVIRYANCPVLCLKNGGQYFIT